MATSGGGGGGGLDMAAGCRELYFGSLRMEQGKVMVGEDASAAVWQRAWDGEIAPAPRNPNPKYLPNAIAGLLSSSPIPPAQDDSAEEYMSGLVEHVACSMLDEDERKQQHEEEDDEKSVPWALKCPKLSWPTSAGEKQSLPSSPQSTLAGIGANTWDFSPTGSSGGLSSGVSSPPTPVGPQAPVEERDALDLLYAELVRLKMEDEKRACQQYRIQQLQRQQQYKQQLLQLRMRQQQQAVDLSSGGGGGKANGYGAVSANYAKAVGYLERKDYTQQKQQQCVRNGTGTYWGNRNWADMVAAAAPIRQNQQQQQQQQLAAVTAQQQRPHAAAGAMNGSGMRAVFLGTRGSRESGGTGVFLPRRIGSGPDTKRKPACSTVLLPSRIVQALNLNVEDTLAGPMPCASPAFVSPVARRDQAWCQSPQDRNLIGESRTRSEMLSSHRPQIAPLQEVAPDISLPTEWTY